jgi:hypothetical protein
MRAAIIGGRTFNGYKYEIWNLLEHGRAKDEELNWLTDFAKARLNTLEEEMAAAHGRNAKSNVKWLGLKALLQDCHENAILNVPNVTPENYMEYVQAQREPDGRFRKPSNYRGRSSALHHIFCSHRELEGYPEGFEERLKTLRTGFLRTVVAGQGETYTDDDDGKKPMSPELYRALCGWFYKSGTPDYLFAYCFLVLTWNLMCRANNTTNIRLHHMTFFGDALVIKFAQQKGDQLYQPRKDILA